MRAFFISITIVNRIKIQKNLIIYSFYYLQAIEKAITYTHQNKSP